MPFWMRKPGASQGKKVEDRKKRLKKSLTAWAWAGYNEIPPSPPQGGGGGEQGSCQLAVYKQCATLYYYKIIAPDL